MLQLFVRVLVCLSFAFAASAQQSSPKEVTPKDVELKKAAEPLFFGQRIELKVDGGWLQQLDAATKTGSVQIGEVVSIYLDGTRMPKLPCSLQWNASEVVLSVTLDRDSQSADSRKAWAAVLSRDPNSGFQHRVGVAVGLAGSRPIHVGEIVLAVNSSGVIWTVIVVGVLLFFALLWVLKRSTNMLRDDGAESPFSLGKTQMAFWGLLVVLTFAGLWVVGGHVDWIPPQVLVLIGISSGTGLASLVVGAGKRNEAARTLAMLQAEKDKLAASAAAEPTAKARLEQVEREIAALRAASESMKSTGSFWQDICTDTAGLSFHRLQIVLWTIVLGCIFVHQVVLTLTMPEFPETLLLLMGISNGTYLGFKIPEK